MEQTRCVPADIAKLKTDIAAIVDKIGITDPQQQANMKFLSLDIMLNEMLQEAFTGNITRRNAFEKEMQRLNTAQMIDEEQQSQYRARADLIIEISRRFQNPNVTLNALRTTINTLDDLILNDRWDEANASIDALGLESGLGEEIKNLKEYLKKRAELIKEMTKKSYSYLKNNAYPMLCWLMAFICLLPDICKGCLRQVLPPTLEYLFEMTSTPAACAYWQAKVAEFMYNAGQDITPTDVDNATWALFGGINNVSQLCVSTTFSLMDTFMTVSTMGGNIFLQGLSALSGYLNIADLPSNFGAFDTESTSSSKKTKSSIATTDSFLTATGVPDYRQIKAVIQGMLDQRSDGARSVISSPQSDDVTQGEVNEYAQALNEENNTIMVETAEERDARLADNERSLASIGDINAFMRNNKRKSGGNTAGRRRKSRRHKKRRSTLKRRRMKRRRTRKGKKRRHTRKH